LPSTNSRRTQRVPELMLRIVLSRSKNASRTASA
jgi:hypothetical protein